MKISAVINAKNEEKMIGDCLRSVSFCDEIILIDTGSTDKTVSLAKEMKAHVFVHKTDDFSEMKMVGKEKATNEWLLYIDADERVGDTLRESIRNAITKEDAAAYKITRQNFYLGNTPWPKKESFLRLFRKDRLMRWEGKLHESAVVDGKTGELKGDLLHYTHRDLTSMVAKTIEWSKVEAELRFHARHPAMSWWRFPRVMIGAFFQSYVNEGGWRVGTVGIVESIYQAFSAFITYARLWEMQSQSTMKKET